MILLNNIRKSGKIKGMYLKMNENEWKTEIVELVKRMDRLECKWDALMRRLEGLERHPEDEGWFD